MLAIISLVIAIASILLSIFLFFAVSRHNASINSIVELIGEHFELINRMFAKDETRIHTVAYTDKKQ